MIIPEGSGTVPLKITTTAGDSISVNFTYLYIPVITGNYTGLAGRSLVINGTNLTRSIVSFGLTPVMPTNVNPTNLTVVIPDGSGTIPLMLTSPAGVSLPVNFTYIDTPIINGTYNALEGTILTIKGKNFTSSTSVSFGLLS